MTNKLEEFELSMSAICTRPYERAQELISVGPGVKAVKKNKQMRLCIERELNPRA